MSDSIRNLVSSNLLVLATVAIGLKWSCGDFGEFEWITVGSVALTLAIFEFGRGVERKNLQKTDYRKREPLLTVERARVLVTLFAAANVYAIASDNFIDRDEWFKMAHIAVCLATLNISLRIIRWWRSTPSDEKIELWESIKHFVTRKEFNTPESVSNILTKLRERCIEVIVQVVFMVFVVAAGGFGGEQLKQFLATLLDVKV